jgi:IclR family pca regulon transcriptional regulator
MSTLAGLELREHARPTMEDLRRRSACAVSLTVLDGIEILYVDHIHSPRRGQSKVGINLQPGSRLPAHCTAMGKVLLAHLPSHEQHDLIADMVLTKHTPHTIANRLVFCDILAQIPERGLAVNNCELEIGLHAIAVPLRNGTQEVVAAIGISALSPMIRSETLVSEFGHHLIFTADCLSTRLGYHED